MQKTVHAERTVLPNCLFYVNSLPFKSSPFLYIKYTIHTEPCQQLFFELLLKLDGITSNNPFGFLTFSNASSLLSASTTVNVSFSRALFTCLKELPVESVSVLIKYCVIYSIYHI